MLRVASTIDWTSSIINQLELVLDMGALDLVRDWDKKDSGVDAPEDEMASEVSAEMEITLMVL